MSIVSDKMNEASTTIMNALTYQGFFSEDRVTDDAGDVHNVGNAHTTVNGVKVEVVYTKPEIKVIANGRVRTAFIVRPVDYDERDIRGIASTVYATATKLARDVK